MIHFNYILFLNLGGGEVILILFVILLMFGGKGIPSIAKTLGKGIREFKDAVKDVKKEVDSAGNELPKIDDK